MGRPFRRFELINAGTVDEAVRALSKYDGRAWPFAGGTDVLRVLRFRPLPEDLMPDALVNLKTISPSMSYIKEEDGVLRIGATTRLADISRDPLVRSGYQALAEAAEAVATPQIREMGTIAGNISQLPQCLYFRKPDDRFHCARKGGSVCYAQSGDYRYHSIFGAVNNCIMPNTSDIAPALVALGARIVTNKRTLEAEEFWDVRVPGNTVLDRDEIITEIQVTRPPPGARSKFLKFAVRKSIDFPLVNVAVVRGDGVARVALNAVAPKPYRAYAAEEVLLGGGSEEEAASAALDGAVPLQMNRWKIPVARTLVKRALLMASGRGAEGGGP
ncbi:MAG: FAD binding domain-containing protein [Nitrososphaeria archaeon]